MSKRRMMISILLISLTVATGPGIVSVGAIPATSAPDNLGQEPQVISDLPTAPDWSAENDQAGARLGEYTATAGDVNGDGYDDVVVGARFYDGGATDSGRAYLFYGSAVGLSTTPDRIFEPPVVELNGYFGGPLGTVGDVNGDGYDDLAIAMVNYDSAYSDEGAVFVWYGSASGPGATYDWMARGDALYAHFGNGLGSAGDVNGDGYDDIIVGAYRYDYNDVSHAYVWYGSDAGLGPDGSLGNADWIASAPTYTANGHAFGALVGPAGDVNGDGYDDVYVGAPLYDNGEVDEGGVFVWYGSDAGLGPYGTLDNADWMAEGNQAEANLGRADAAGDVNGDGYDDLVVSAITYDNGQTNEGAAFIWYGSSSGLGANGAPANAAWTAESDQADAQFGFDVGPAGDVNGDGYADVIVGARYYDDPEVGEGAAFVYYGSALGPSTTADWIGDSGQASAYMGWVVGPAGDVNGDNVADVLVSAPYYDNPEEDEGRVFVYHGSSDVPPPPPPPPSTGSFTFYAIYDRLVDDDSLNADLYHAALSGDGEKLIFSGTDTTSNAPVLYTVDADGSGLTQVTLPDLGGRGIAGLAIDRDGSRAFFSTGSPSYDELYKVEGGAVTKILDSDDYGEVNGVYEIQTTADGEYVYFQEDRDDLWRVGHGGGAPTQIVDDAAVPRDGGTGSMIIEFDLSADASTVTFILNGYRDTGNVFHYKREVFVLDGGTYRQLTNDSGDVIKEELAISGDGATVVYGAGAPQWKWYSIRSNGSARIPLEDMVGNFGGLALTYDGTSLFYQDDGANGGRLVHTDGSGGLDLFPEWSNIMLAATWDLAISKDGHRVSFRTPDLYIGYLNDPDAVPSAPEIEDISFNPAVMPKDDPSAEIVVTSQMDDPQGLADITRVSTDEVVDGRLADYADLPVEIPFSAHDDGASPDQTAGDGIFSAFGRPGQAIAESDQMTVRMAAQDDSATVVVADTTLLIGSANQMPLLPPTNVQVQPGLESIELTWDPSPSPNLAGYNVYRSTSPEGGFEKINTALVTGDRYLDTSTLIPDTAYFYYMTAVDGSNDESDPSNIAFAVFGQLKFFIPDAYGDKDASVTLPVNIANADGIEMCAVDIYVTYEQNVLTATDVQRTALTTGYGWAKNIETPGIVRAVIATTEGELLYGEGTLFNVLFDVIGNSGDTSELEFQVAGTFFYDCDDLVNAVPLDLTDVGVFTVQGSFMLGDLNGDGLVNSADAALALQIAVGNVVPSPRQLVAGDVNGDGRINSADAALIMRLAAGLEMLPSVAQGQALSAAQAGSVGLSAPGDATVPQGSSAWVPLSIDDATNLAGADVTLNYDPFVATATGARATSLSANFDVEFNVPVAGQAKISLKPKVGYEDGLTGGSGALMEIEFTTSSAATVGSTSPLNLVSVRLSDRYGRDFATSALQVQVNATNGVLTVEESQCFIFLPVIVRSGS